MQSFQKNVFHLDYRRDYQKLFPELLPLRISDDELMALTRAIQEGKPGKDSQAITNGEALLGQFLAHDLTFEASSRTRFQAGQQASLAPRRHHLDLDTLYGQWTQDFLYDEADDQKLLLGQHYSAGKFAWYDLQRNAQHKAIIPDSRNDENLITAAMQVAFIRFHNTVVDRLRESRGRQDVYPEARRLVIWHYHWIIIHQYLRKMMDPFIYDDLLTNGPKYYCDASFLPLEMTGAAFRVGHAQSRDQYRVHADRDLSLQELGQFSAIDQPIDWRYLFDYGDGKVQHALKIDTHVSPTFHHLPFLAGQGEFARSLPYLNLLRSREYGLPSGEDVAKRMELDPIDVPLTRNMGLEGTPLWYYILFEAECLFHGEHLGPVGSRLLGEAFYIQMIQDGDSYLQLYPKWKPAWGRVPGQFDFVDLLKVAEG